MSELNSRQWHLYNFLKERGESWTLQENIAYALKDFYDVSTIEGDFHNSRARFVMTNDIRTINESSVIQKIIISGPKGVKIANAEEWQKYIRGEYSLVFKKLKRLRVKERKGCLNGQTRIVFKQERDTIEAFLHEN